MQPQTSQDALAALQQYRGGMRSSGDILADQSRRFGVDAAGETVSGLRGAINNTTKLLRQVAPSVMGRTAQSLVTNAQATRQIANESAPIAQQLSDQGSQLGMATDEYGRALDRAQTATSGLLNDQENQLSYLQNIYNNLYGREQMAEDRRRYEQDRADRLAADEAARREAKAAQATQAANWAKYFENPDTQTTAFKGQTLSTNTQDDDAAYLGRLRENYKDDPYGLITVLRGMANSKNPLAVRRYNLAKELKLFPTGTMQTGGGGW